jgi:hypothetical protein
MAFWRIGGNAMCGVGYRLWLDFKGNSVTRTPYPMKGGGWWPTFQDPEEAYLLRGEGLVLHPEAAWDHLRWQWEAGCRERLLPATEDAISFRHDMKFFRSGLISPITTDAN